MEKTECTRVKKENTLETTENKKMEKKASK